MSLPLLVELKKGWSNNYLKYRPHLHQIDMNFAVVVVFVAVFLIVLQPIICILNFPVDLVILHYSLRLGLHQALLPFACRVEVFQALLDLDHRF